MVQRSMKFTPKAMLSAPRRSAGLPNSAGDTILHTTSTYSFKTHSKETELRVVEVKTGAGLPVVTNKDVSGICWLDNENFVFLQAEKDGTTSLCVSKIPWDRRTVHRSEPVPPNRGVFVAGTIKASASDLKIAKLDQSEEFGVIFAAQAAPDGTLVNAEKVKKTQSTGRLYSSLYVRHWDRYETQEKNALWYGKLCISSSGKFELSGITNALKGTGLECPILPFGGTDNFDICHNCIMFVAKDPELNPALSVKTGVYIIRMNTWDESPAPLPKRVDVLGYEGACTNPVISTDGRNAAFLAMKTAGYEADRNNIFLLQDLDSQGSLQAVIDTTQDIWDRSPSSICFAADSKSILVVAEEHGNAKLFMLNAGSTQPKDITTLTNTGYVNSVSPLSNGTVFISATTLIDNSLYAILDPLIKHGEDGEPGDLTVWSHSNSANGNKFGLDYIQVSSIWTPASNPEVNKEIHSIVVKPSKFDSSKKYPVAYLIHGGPQGSWADNWSTRWNPAVFAEQGYIVIAPNPTGSTGYGQKFTDSIRKNWGGDPYNDIVNCFEWVGKNMPEADNDRAVALGASYGGYMMNWIQGHDLGRKFKALVCHDGILSMAGMLATEELYFPFYDIGGTPWFDPFEDDKQDTAAAQAHKNFGPSTFADWRQWDPSEHFSNWSTPQLVIHSSKDYRICIADGLAAFNVLQARGVDSQFLTFPDENHWVLKPENSLAWHKVVLNWINKYVDLPPFTTEEPDDDEFWGGIRDGKQEVVEIMAQGKPET